MRAVDHFSWSSANGRKGRKRKAVKSESVNGHFTVERHITHDHLDDLHAAMRLQFDRNAQAPGLWKADIDAAFRRIPLKEDHKWAAAVAYIFEGEPWVAVHEAMPFGATASVHAWDAVGDAICEIARSRLHLPVYRYVDDYFAAERCARVQRIAVAPPLCACKARRYGAWPVDLCPTCACYLGPMCNCRHESRVWYGPCNPRHTRAIKQ